MSPILSLSRIHLQVVYERLERMEGHKKAIEIMSKEYQMAEAELEKLIVRVKSEIEGA